MNILQPYYDHGGITIYCGRAEDIVGALGPFDLVSLDPPYGHGEKWQGGGWAANPIYADARHDWDRVPVGQHLIDACVRSGTHAIVWGGNYYAMPPSRCYLAWNKVPHMGTMADFELAWTNFDQPAKMFSESRNADGKREHPTQKPLSLARWALSHVPWHTLLVPFMGSGPELRIAKDLGRRAIGIDVSERYCEVAAKRLRQECLFADG
jgi:DNA modification methylase